MLVKTKAAAILGVDAITITIEVNVSMGQGYNVVGLPDNAIKESMDRTESAIKAMGYHMPRTKLLVNLSPADLKKSGAAFDLPIAIGILAASEQLQQNIDLASIMMIGELGLDGHLYPIKGALAMTLQAKKEGFKCILLPAENLSEASMVTNFSVVGLEHLSEVIQFLTIPNSHYPTQWQHSTPSSSTKKMYPSFNDIKGQEQAKRAISIACAGNHNLLLVGPPGAGKTMLAKSMLSILPPLSSEEALETMNIYSISGKLNDSTVSIWERPFRQPHHTITEIALIGGGSIPQPGEISLAHNGILFLDELPEFKRNCIEVLRQPIEEGEVIISRAKQQIRFPARFLLVAAMNPCPCGYYTHPTKTCHCSINSIRNYLKKISGPLLDRIDLQVELPPLAWEDLFNKTTNSSSEQNLITSIQDTRAIQLERYHNKEGIYCNAQLDNEGIRMHCALDAASTTLLESTMKRFQLSARAYSKILKISRTIADMAGTSQIQIEHLSEAIQYRKLDSPLWEQNQA